MRNYKEMAKAMREAELKYKNGVLEVSVELWEEIADALEEKSQGAPILELIYKLATEEKVNLYLHEMVGGMITKVRKDGLQYAFRWEPDLLSAVSAEEDFFYRLRNAAERLEKELRRRREAANGKTIGADTEA